MKIMNNIEVFVDRYNMLMGTVIAILSYVLGEHWFLFVAFLGLNVLDWLTGWMKSRMTGRENSAKGWMGVMKKLGYWIMILSAFGIGAVFIEIGEIIGIELGVTTMLGWFVLASLSINEIRSVLENFVEAGFSVPYVLIKGLEVADRAVNKEGEDDDGIQSH
ncbi:MAG: phage holin family protein [Lachnospiraceae bacterium]|nr:phage holin family protein [Lachnospiraceae bacterium]